jgi:LuxR family maltose regulon positive regulatory protein
LEAFSRESLARDDPPERTGDLVEPLSGRELEVLAHIASGATNQEIAQSMYLSLYTVKSHARNIYGKLGVKNRTEAVAKARLLGLLAQA